MKFREWAKLDYQPEILCEGVAPCGSYHRNYDGWIEDMDKEFKCEYTALEDC